MVKNKQVYAFTLTELLVWIGILAILWVWISQLNINRLSGKQQLEIEIIKIVNIIESARNNALIWRGVWVSLDTPDNWYTTISGTWGVIWWWNLWVNSEVFSQWNPKFPFEITNLRCQRIDGLDDLSSNSEILINYTGSEIDITWCSDNSYKKVVFDFTFRDASEQISINAITWVVTKN